MWISRESLFSFTFSVLLKSDIIELTFHPWKVVYTQKHYTWLVQSVGAVEYTNCFSAARQDTPNECPGYDTKQSDGEIPVMLELWGIQSFPLLPSLPGPLFLLVVVYDRVLSMDQIELKCAFIQNWITRNRAVFVMESVLMLTWIVWNKIDILYKNGFGIN